MNNNSKTTENFCNPNYFGNLIKFLFNPFSFFSSNESSPQNSYYNNQIHNNNNLSTSVSNSKAGSSEKEKEKSILKSFHQQYNILNDELYSVEIINLAKDIIDKYNLYEMKEKY